MQQKNENETCDEMGIVADSKGLDRPFACERSAEDGVVSASEVTRFRSLAGTANYLNDRSDIQFGVEEICRKMAAPTKSSVARVKRLARDLAEYARLVWDFGRKGGGSEDATHMFADSDWVGCPRARR